MAPEVQRIQRTSVPRTGGAAEPRGAGPYRCGRRTRGPSCSPRPSSSARPARVCESAAQHARTREQFGRAAGAFRAVRRLCARTPLRVEVARAAVCAAAATADPVEIVAARLPADETAVPGARDAASGCTAAWASPGRQRADLYPMRRCAPEPRVRVSMRRVTKGSRVIRCRNSLTGRRPAASANSGTWSVADCGIPALRSVDIALCPRCDSSRPGVEGPLRYLV
ncbi:acyl-CoA dehydrogenase family protein [Streptomyces chromofuscus]|uniref:acyl-CoA dehydrogenase family protein n=1 Tax=Streptomyces chromofuscus TaxID=42881 RepID=UPI0035714A40